MKKAFLIFGTISASLMPSISVIACSEDEPIAQDEVDFTTLENLFNKSEILEINENWKDILNANGELISVSKNQAGNGLNYQITWTMELKLKNDATQKITLKMRVNEYVFYANMKIDNNDWLGEEEVDYMNLVSDGQKLADFVDKRRKDLLPNIYTKMEEVLNEKND